MASPAGVAREDGRTLTRTHPQPGQAGAPAVRAWRVLLPALLSSALLWLSFFPVACGWLAWVALLPWLALVRSPARPRTLYLLTYLVGLAFYWPALQWMRVADPRMYVTWAALATYCPLYLPLALYLVRRLDRRTRLPLVVTFPVVWTALEFFRAEFMGGFASRLLGTHQHDYPGGFTWYFLGYSQHDFLEVIQVADLAGVYGVSFLLCAVNALLFEALYARAWFRDALVGPGAPQPATRLALLGQGLGVGALLLATLAYGSWRLRQDAFTPGPRLALVQGNLDQRIRNDVGGPDAARSKQAKVVVVDHFGRLGALASAYGPDLIVLPETSYPDFWEELAPGVPDAASREIARRVADAWHTNALLGLSSDVVGDDGKRRSYNSAVLVGKDARYLGRYDKIHRVPFGEYIPLKDLFPVIKRLAPYDYDYEVRPGADFTRFPLTAAGHPRPFSFGVVICYEDTIAAMARPYGGGDGLPPADFVLNISNDGWFDGTAEHDQHLAICRFRAVECRRAVARAVNMGVSALIDGNGRVLAPRSRPTPGWAFPGAKVWDVPRDDRPAGLPVSRWHEFKKVPGVLLATVPVDTRVSLYARWGDWLPGACWAVLLGVILVEVVRRRLGRRTAASAS
jgi:apolipoprotein N-acyltransferase